MMKSAMCSFCLAIVLSAPSVVAAENDNPRVRMVTSEGEVVIELYAGKAPVTVKNFLSYVEDGAYDGTLFHRMIPGFMIQGGGYTPELEEREARKTIRNEADNGLKNERGTIAMARRNEIDSAGRQFFVNVADNAHLDHTAESCTREEMKAHHEARQKGLYKPLTCDNFGYAVFGRVVEGMDVVDSIESVETQAVNAFANLPVEPVIIERIEKVGAP